MSRFVFLDRDGTLVRDTGYTHRLEDYALLPGAVEGLGKLVGGGYRLAIVTNQSGIGRGYYTTEQYQAFQDHLERDLSRRGISIERTYCCPHRPEDNCPCRKPAPALLLRARDELGAVLAESWTVGDSAADVELALQAGCRGAVWIRSSPQSQSEARFPTTPRARDLNEAAGLILGSRQGRP